MDLHEISMNCQLMEFVETTFLDSIGLVIGGIDELIRGRGSSAFLI